MVVGSRTRSEHRCRPTDDDVINGAVVREADARDVKVPLNRAIVELVKGYERAHGLACRAYGCAAKVPTPRIRTGAHPSRAGERPYGVSRGRATLS